MKRSTRAFVIAATILPLAAFTGCKDGQLDPAISGAIGGLGGGGGGSKEASYLQAGMQGAQGWTMNDADAAEVGESVALAAVSQYGVVDDDALLAYVTNVGLTVAACSSRPDINYTFGVLATDEVNALSMPGGFVFITRGALMKMQDESELAGVLAHEVGHLCLSHGKKALQDAARTSAFITVVGTESRDLATLIDAGNTALLKPKHSQGDESNADVEAVKILRAAGYDPGGLARFLERVQVGASTAGGVSSHPATPDRVAKIKAAAGSAKGATLQERFARMTKK